MAAVTEGPKLARIVPKLMDGPEAFHFGGQALPVSVRDFWRWACSDLVGNSLRGLVAEYLVAHAVGSDQCGRVEWDAYDVQTPAGVRIEVKTSGYLQSWEQPRLSTISFDIAPKRSWYSETNTYSVEAMRAAHVYVFALHKHQDKATLDPLDVDQWVFYVVPVTLLDEQFPRQRTIRLSGLSRLGANPIPFSQLADAITAAAGTTEPLREPSPPTNSA